MACYKIGISKEQDSGKLKKWLLKENSIGNDIKLKKFQKKIKKKSIFLSLKKSQT